MLQVEIINKSKHELPKYSTIQSAGLDIKANILAYLDMEQFHLMQIRDEYRTVIENMSTDINVPVHLCHNLAEFKRRVELKQYTHYFI